MKNNILNLLEIQGYKVESVEEAKDQKLIVKVRKKKGYKNTCPACGGLKVSCHARGKYRLKKHSHFQEKLIYLKIKRDRLICLKCKKVFSEELPNIKRYSRVSNNFVKQSLNYLSKNSFNEVATVNAVSYQSLKTNLYDNVDPFKLLDEKIKLLSELEEIYLGLDGQSFRGLDMVLTITEVKLRELLTILPSECQADLNRFLKRLSPEIRAKVKGISMDMTNKHHRLLKANFPNALIVIDHYHVISCAIMHLQKVRTTLQQAKKIAIPIKKELDKNKEYLTENDKDKMIKYFKLFPELFEAYQTKERVRALYKMTDYNEAKKEMKAIILMLKNSKEDELKELGRTMIHWKQEILNYFKCRITNAYTEGLHTKCKLIKRKSFGFRNVETYVRKLILGLLPFAMIWNYTHFST
ncbi:MAG: ISL3 family transposase [Patescibacteria group bacterium]|jgi:transposase|nr:ISL3 family transposase [Patescibacteria group bacterium]